MNRLIFISHRESDAKVAEPLVNLLLSSLEITEDEIRCTSVPGHKLDFGKAIDDQFKADIRISTVVVALLTKQSLESNWVLFELGASWEYGKMLLPILGSSLSVDDLPDPLRRINCVQITKPSAREDLVAAVKIIARELGITMKTSSRADRDLTEFIETFRSHLAPSYLTDTETKAVTFVCNSEEASAAKDVYVAGSFNDWLNAKNGRIQPHDYFKLTKRERQGKIIWGKTLHIPVGPHDFKFVVGNNYWIHWSEGSAYAKGSDAPGGSNFRITVE